MSRRPWHRRYAPTSWPFPVLAPVPHPQDADIGPRDPVHDDVGRKLGNDEFARVGSLSRPASVWLVSQALDRRTDSLIDTQRGGRILPGNVLNMAVEITPR